MQCIKTTFIICTFLEFNNIGNNSSITSQPTSPRYIKCINMINKEIFSEKKELNSREGSKKIPFVHHSTLL